MLPIEVGSNDSIMIYVSCLLYWLTFSVYDCVQIRPVLFSKREGIIPTNDSYPDNEIKCIYLGLSIKSFDTYHFKNIFCSIIKNGFSEVNVFAK